jgi:PAS domain S-box-containing protein
VKESEEQYRNIVEDQTEFISRFLPDGTHIFVNDAYCRYFGIAREDILGHRFRPVIHSDDREAVAGFFATLTLTNPVGIIDQRTIMPDGSTRWQRWSDRAIFDAYGNVVQYQSVGRDITEYKQAEEALKEREEQLHLAIDSANLGLWDMNLINGEMVHNQRWAEMLGFSKDELEKPSEWWGQRVHPLDYQNVTNLSNLHRAGKVPFFDAVYRMKHKNGEWRWVHSAGKIISRDSDGVALRMTRISPGRKLQNRIS